MASSRASFWRRLRWRVEWVFVRGAMAALQCLSYEAGEALMRGAARLYLRIDRTRWRTALEGLRLAFRDTLDVKAREDLARRAFEHAFVLIFEVVVRHRLVPTLRAFRARTRIFGDEAEGRADAARGRAGFLLTAHYGSWETAGSYLAYEGIPLAAVARSVPNPYVQRLLTSTRSASLRILEKRGATAASVAAIRAGTFVAVLGDQNAGHHGVFVPFFGVPASTYPFVATLAMRYDLPVFFGVAVRRGPRFRYDFHINRYVPDPTIDPDQAVPRLLNAYHAWLEERIREAPEQYFWMHRRWKTRPRGEPPGEWVPRYDHRGGRVSVL